MRSIVTEYVDLCAQLAARAALIDASTEAQLYSKIDELWYSAMSAEERVEAARLVAETM